MPSETSYPAFFSVLAKDQASGQPVTNNLLTYVKTSTSARWKLSLSSQILGPTAAGVTVPAATTNSAGYVTALDPASSDGLALAPDKVAARVAAAFTTEAASGKLPSGVSAEFGPNKEADPHAIAATFARLGSATTTFSATTPAAAAGTSSAACPRPAIRLANGGALVTFAVFVSVAVHVKKRRRGRATSRQKRIRRAALAGDLLLGHDLQGDMGVAIVPPAGSHASIDVIGQAIEGLTETGVSGSGSSGSGAVIGPANAAAIAKGIDSKVVDVETTLGADERAFGTGMVLKSNGEVLTNNHVVEGATSINVTDVGNGKTYKATVVGYDRSADVAVLQLQNASGLATVSIGDSATVHKGALVVGVGNAGGTGGTPSYTGGSVIALGQSITASDQGDGTSEQLTGLMETDADIQPGDSGGPLVNTSGKVIGMDTAASGGFSFEPGSSSSSQAFSIPINTAVNVAGQITSGKSSSVVHIGPTAFLGVALAALAAPGQDRIGQPAPSSGAQIATVVSGSPAAKAGLEEGDTITSFAGHPVTTPNSLTTVISGLKPGAVCVARVPRPLGQQAHRHCPPGIRTPPVSGRTVVRSSLGF